MKTNVAVFFGGRSVEHEISVLSALQGIAAFNKEKYNIVPIYISKEGKWYTGDALLDVRRYKDPKSLLADCEQVYMRPEYGDFNLYKVRRPRFASKQPVVAELHVAVPILHGTNGEDGVFEGLLETIGLPFAGCNTLSSANGMDKITMKMILRESGLPVVDYIWCTDKEWHRRRDEIIAQVEERLGYPVVVKPANLGSSVGIGMASDRSQLIEKMDNAEKYSHRLIVEHAVRQLKEINCSVLGDADDNESSICEEPIKSGEILSYLDKYGAGGGTKGGVKGGGVKFGAKNAPAQGMAHSDKRIPADIPTDTSDRIRHLAQETFRVLGCHGVARVDVMIEEADGSIYVNEINTIPGSLSYYLWEESGLSFGKLLDRLVELALRRRREHDRKTLSLDANIFALGGGVKGQKK